MTTAIEELKAALPPLPEMIPGAFQKTAKEGAAPCPKCGGRDRLFFSHDRFT